MNLLLDTHALIWFFDGSPKIPARVTKQFEDPDSAIFISAATIWEAEIKAAMQKLPLPGQFLEMARAFAEGGMLSIDAEDAVVAARLPRHHGDPFDRMLIAQAMRRELTIVTGDDAFRRYEVRTMWG